MCKPEPTKEKWVHSSVVVKSSRLSAKITTYFLTSASYSALLFVQFIRKRWQNGHLLLSDSNNRSCLLQNVLTTLYTSPILLYFSKEKYLQCSIQNDTLILLDTYSSSDKGKKELHIANNQETNNYLFTDVRCVCVEILAFTILIWQFPLEAFPIFFSLWNKLTSNLKNIVSLFLVEILLHSL